MKQKYIVLASLLIIFAFCLVLLPGNKGPAETSPKELLSSISEKSRYLSVDQVTSRIIENDPALMLIDLRTADQFNTFTLPGAIRIDPDSLLTENSMGLLRQPGMDKVLFSNADITAEKAWLLCMRYSLNRIYIMKGGMNEWFNTIINQKEISATPSSSDLDLADFRKAARQFFIGAEGTVQKPESPGDKKKIIVTRKTPKTGSGGGC
jgi:sulfur-carrier protein adenylyltransferase/sulfurtransferase